MRRSVAFLLPIFLMAGTVLSAGCARVPNAPVATPAQSTTLQAAGAIRIEDVQGIGTSFGAKLRELGITTVARLQDATVTEAQRSKLAERAGISPKLVQSWAQQADLMRVKGIGTRLASLIWSVGITGLANLAKADPAKLAERVSLANAFEPRFVANTPEVATITRWIEAAKSLVTPPAPEPAGLAAGLGIQQIMVLKLRKADITDMATLEAATTTRSARQKVSERTGLPYQWVLNLAWKVQLMKIDGIGLGEANLLTQVGAASVHQLAESIADDLHYEMGRANAAEPRYVPQTPGKDVVNDWVEAARKLAPTLDER